MTGSWGSSLQNSFNKEFILRLPAQQMFLFVLVYVDFNSAPNVPFITSSGSASRPLCCSRQSWGGSELCYLQISAVWLKELAKALSCKLFFSQDSTGFFPVLPCVCCPCPCRNWGILLWAVQHSLQSTALHQAAASLHSGVKTLHFKKIGGFFLDKWGWLKEKEKWEHRKEWACSRCGGGLIKNKMRAQTGQAEGLSPILREKKSIKKKRLLVSQWPIVCLDIDWELRLR